MIKGYKRYFFAVLMASFLLQAQETQTQSKKCVINLGWAICYWAVLTGVIELNYIVAKNIRLANNAIIHHSSKSLAKAYEILMNDEDQRCENEINASHQMRLVNNSGRIIFYSVAGMLPLGLFYLASS